MEDKEEPWRLLFSRKASGAPFLEIVGKESFYDASSTGINMLLSDEQIRIIKERLDSFNEDNS